MAALFDPFVILGLERDAVQDDIKARYRDLARKYHPNRNRASQEQESGLADRFRQVHEAWQLLADPDDRRRCVEILELYDQHETVTASFADLHYPHGQKPTAARQHRHSSNGHSLSDSEDDDALHHDGLQEQGRQSGNHDHGFNEDNHHVGHDRGSAQVRHEEQDRLRRAEFEAFRRYRDATVARWQAEDLQRDCKGQYELAKWQRRDFDNAPKEPKQRVRLAQLISMAAKAFIAQQPPAQRKDSSARHDSPVTRSPTSPTSGRHLSLPSRMKSVHRRQFSNDISIDQDSDDDTDYPVDRPISPARSPRAISPRRDYHMHRHSEPAFALEAFRHHSLSAATDDPISPITGPVKVLIKQASNLHEMLIPPDSDADTASTSSRSASPQHMPRDAPNFVLLPPAQIGQVFHPEERRVSSTVEQVQFGSRPSTPLSSLGEVGDFSMKEVHRPRHKIIPFQHVHELTFEDKRWMLSKQANADVDSQDLLARLEELDSTVAQSFMVKPDIKARFHFRLIYGRQHVVKQQGQTFIALSYRRKLHVEKRKGSYTLPLAAEMFQAVWNERQSETEGVWIDQICIDSNSEEEKVVSMSAMDMVYRSARLIVVALDDIHLDHHESEILAAHMEAFDEMQQVPAHKRFRRRQTPYLDAHEDLYTVIRKILSSSWFRRAWCRHEMRLAREHIFLVPCTNPKNHSSKNIIRFTGRCFTHFLGLATEVPFQPPIEAVKPALYAFFRDRSKLLTHEPNVSTHHGNFTTVVADVFAMEAGGDPKIAEEQRASDARKDKISIVLNTMECGLSLRPETRNPLFALPLARCHYMMLMLALAARDPGALSSVGRPLLQLLDAPQPSRVASTWLFEPSNVDSGLNNYKTLNRLPASASISTTVQDGHHFVDLALKFLRPGRVQHAVQSPNMLDLAHRLIAFCNDHKLGRNRRQYLIDDHNANHYFGSMKDVYAETLVCVLECGPDWLSDVCVRYGVSRWRQDLQPAWDLMVALKSTHGRWPRRAWSRTGAGFLLDVVNFLIIRGMPRRQIIRPEAWKPIWVEVEEGGKVVTFIPAGDIRVAVPAALLDRDYIHLARLWVLEPRDECNEETIPHHKEWTLLGKSVLFSDDAATGHHTSQNGLIREHHKVFGMDLS